MTVDDRTRLNLHRKLDAVLGPEEADTLMSHLPSVTWHDVATKDDLGLLGRELRSDMQVGFADTRTEVAGAITRQTKWMVTFVAAWSTLLLAAASLIG